MKKFLLAMLLIAAMNGMTHAAGNYVEGEALVTLRNGVGTLNAASISSTAGRSYVNSVASLAEAEATVIYNALSAGSGKIIVLMKSETKSTMDLIADLEKNPSVLNASPNYRVRALAAPNDILYSALWGMEKIRAHEAWDITTGSGKVHIAVVDSGIDPDHVDLVANIDLGRSRDFTKDGDIADVHSHGTHVAGTIAAVGNNGIGVAGVNWSAKIIALKVFAGENGGGTDAEIIAALNYLVELLEAEPDLVLPAVNLSLGEWTPRRESWDDPLWLAFKTLDETNRTVIVVAAGNEFRQVGVPADVANPDMDDDIVQGYYIYPASFTGLDNMIVVGAMNVDDSGSDFTNWSSETVHVIAPGGELFGYLDEDILSTIPENEEGHIYGFKRGTSMAAPHVAGAVALLAAGRMDKGLPPLPASTLKSLICESANSNINPEAPAIDIELNPPVKISPQGVADTTVSKYGLLDVKAAMDALDELDKHGSGGCNAAVVSVTVLALFLLLLPSIRKMKVRSR